MLKRMLRIMLVSITILVSISIIKVNVSALTLGDFEYDYVNSGVRITKYTGKESYVYIPNTIDGKKVIEIGKEAFKDNQYIEQVEFNRNLSAIGYGAFYNCSSLISVDIPDNVEYIYSNGNGDDSWYPTIGTFGNCKNLKSVKIGNGLKKIYPYTFYKSYALENVSIGKNVEIIERGAFQHCEYLKSVKLGTGIQEIEERAFYNCKSLEQIDLQSNVKSIGDYVFRECISLKKISLNEGLKTIGYGAFYNCQSLVSIVIPDSVEYIYSNGYADSSVYKSINTFGGCNNLVNVVLGSGLKSIDPYTFSDCSALAHITIGKNVTRIDSNAFQRCNSLQKVYFMGNYPSYVESKAFSTINPNTVFYYKKGSSGFSNVGFKIDIFTESTYYRYVTFEANGGNSDTILTTSFGLQVARPKTPIRTGYTFLGWNTNPDGTGREWNFLDNTVEQNTTLYARWSRNKYKLKLDTTGGNVSTSSKTISYNYSVGTLPIPTRSGYVFMGWYPGINGTGSKYTSTTKMPAYHVTLYAHWAKKLPIPNNIRAQRSSSTSIDLVWDKVSGTKEYKIYRSTKKDIGFTYIGRTRLTNYTSDSLKTGTTYYYKVKALGSGLYTDSNYSKVVNAIPALSKPTNVKARKNSSTSIKLSWNKVGGAKEYRIYRATSKNGFYKNIGKTTSTSFISKNLLKNKTYYYKLVACTSKSTGNSSYSSVVYSSTK